MDKTLYDTGPMPDSLYACRIIVRKTAKGVAVERDTRVERDDYPSGVSYYADGNYPPIPDNWQRIINDYGVTEAELWFHNLEMYIPYRTTR